MSSITTHVLDTSLGKPAAGLPVRLSVRDGELLRALADSVTDADGRVRQFPVSQALSAGSYQLSFEVRAYFRATRREAFFERVTLEFSVLDASEHFHVPLLLSPFGYTTYRGT
ncbi:MAG: hydroxyisourate hydrolase [Polyangiaceae bacterium]